MRDGGYEDAYKGQKINEWDIWLGRKEFILTIFRLIKKCQKTGCILSSPYSYFLNAVTELFPPGANTEI